MKYLVAVVLVFNCYALKAADRPVGEMELAMITPNDFSPAFESGAFDSSAPSERYEAKTFAAPQASFSEGASSKFSGNENGRRTSSASTPAVLWLFGSILIGFTVMASRKLSSNPRF